jgi:hypothetical protein
MTTAPPTPVSIPLHAPVKLELVLQNLIEVRVNQLPGVRVWRANTGAVAGAGGGFVRFGAKGQGDLIGLMLLPSGVGQHLEIECKRPGERQTKDQRLRQLEVERYGGRYLLAHTLAEALVPLCVALGLSYEFTEAEAR